MADERWYLPSYFFALCCLGKIPGDDGTYRLKRHALPDVIHFSTNTTYLPPPPASSFCALPFLPITGPACHCGRFRLPLLLPLLPSSLPLSPLLPYPLSPLAAARALVAMGDPKRSC